MRLQGCFARLQTVSGSHRHNTPAKRGLITAFHIMSGDILDG